MTELIFDGVNLGEFCDYIYPINTNASPERVYDEYEIAGRNGKLLIDKKYYRNVPWAYRVIITENPKQRYDELIAFFGHTSGYKILEDSDDEDKFMVAKISTVTTPIYTTDQKALKFSISFDRQPQRFLISGQVKQTVASGDVLTNPTLEEARPLIRVYGNGTVVVNGVTITIAGNTEQYIDIDCEEMECHYGETSLNNLVSFSTHEFPILSVGDNEVTFSNITALEITPRWWTI